MSEKIRTIIMGAAGRDFHNFNVVYRDSPTHEVVCFTATQIPDIHGRRYPPELAGQYYPNGIPIFDETNLSELIYKHHVKEVIFSYSDVSYNYVMRRAALVSSCGASFKILSALETMLKSRIPVVSVCAVRTGCGKSQTARKAAKILKQMGKHVVAIRHPMPYGDLLAQKVQRFTTLQDMKEAKCTIEEMEEYEAYVEAGLIIYAGVDYAEILKRAESEAEIILWDGGNNDTPFFEPNIEIVVTDPHRVGHESEYHPGEVNLRRASIAIINKVDTATPAQVSALRANIQALNSGATIIEARSPVSVDNPDLINGKNVLVVEDGPTLTHGGMSYGAAMVAANKFGAREILDPRPYAVGTIKKTLEQYPHIDSLLPAVGYSTQQVKDLEKTINACKADIVISGTPIDLGRIVKINKPLVRVRYELEEIGSPSLEEILYEYLKS